MPQETVQISMSHATSSAIEDFSLCPNQDSSTNLSILSLRTPRYRYRLNLYKRAKLYISPLQLHQYTLPLSLSHGSNNLRHFPKILHHETFSIIAMLTAMIRHKVMANLMTKDNKPIHHRVPSGSQLNLLLMQLLIIQIIAEDAAIPIESDGLAVRLEENVDGPRVKREDARDFLEERGEGRQAGGMRGEELRGVACGGGREEHLNPVLEFGDEGQVVRGVLVAVGLRLSHFVGLAAREDGGRVVGPGLLDGG